MTKTRNGTIDLLRFVFCMVILFFHISTDLYGHEYTASSWNGLFRYGAICVEFFFIASGYYFAKSIIKMSTNIKTLHSDTWKFIYRKLKPILPYHLLFNGVAFCISLFRGHSLSELLMKLSSFLFLPVVGFGNEDEWLLGSEWYIGYMLFAMLILFPVFCLHKSLFSSFIAPVVSIVLYGILSSHYHTVISSNRMIRAFAGIMLGITVHSLSSVIKRRIHMIEKCKTVWFIRFYPVLILVLYFVYFNSTVLSSVQPLIVLILASGLVITFSEEGLISRTNLLNNRFVYWLGSISLPIYLIQNITRRVSLIVFKHSSSIVVYSVAVVLTIVSGILSWMIWSRINRIISKKSSVM